MQRVLVTGAAGFVGRAVVRSLLVHSDAEIIATGRGAAETLPADGGGRLTQLPAIDLVRAEDVARLPAGLTHVVHAAALARFEGARPQQLHEANVLATGNLLQHAAQTSSSTLRRFLFISTFGVHDRPRFYDPASPIRENSPFAAVSDYGRSKRRAERLVRLSGLPHAVARLVWIYGPSMRRDSHIRVLGRMCRRHHPLTRIDFPGRVSVGFIDDVAGALTQLTLKPQLANTNYLIAHATPVSFGEMFRQFSRVFAGAGADARHPLAMAWLTTPLRLAGPAIGMKLRSLVEDYYVCDPSRLTEEGIQLTTAFADGIRASIDQGRWIDD